MLQCFIPANYYCSHVHAWPSSLLQEHAGLLLHAYTMHIPSQHASSLRSEHSGLTSHRSVHTPCVQVIFFVNANVGLLPSKANIKQQLSGGQAGAAGQSPGDLQSVEAHMQSLMILPAIIK